MSSVRSIAVVAAAAMSVLTACAASSDRPVARADVDPLPSWQHGAARASITAFIAAVTDPASSDFVPEAERIAVSDNDGTLWSEQPVYFQLAFALDRIEALAPEHPEWHEQQPYKAVLEGDVAALAVGGHHALLEIIAATHAGLTTGEFAEVVEDWLATARHPRFDRPYTDLVYQPMLELLAYLRANGFTTCIVSGHDDAAREWAYDRDSSIGGLSRGLDEAAARGWTVVSMRHDWTRVD